MTKQKRKIPEVTEKKNKKLKKTSAKEVLLVPGTTSDKKEVHPEAHTNTRDPHVLQVCLNPSGAASDEVPEVNQVPSMSPAEQRALERKLKKERRKEEKRRLWEAGGCPAPQTPATPEPAPSGATLALDYLCSWAQKHQDWKFQKTRQTWLLVHMYDSDKVPDEHFPTLLAYLEGLKGQARELTVQKAEARMQALDAAGAGGSDPLLLGQVQRVCQVLQLLS
ncbi:protein cholesin isoform 1-T1 [Dugong dugon]